MAGPKKAATEVGGAGPMGGAPKPANDKDLRRVKFTADAGYYKVHETPLTVWKRAVSKATAQTVKRKSKHKIYAVKLEDTTTAVAGAGKGKKQLPPIKNPPKQITVEPPKNVDDATVLDDI